MSSIPLHDMTTAGNPPLRGWAFAHRLRNASAAGRALAAHQLTNGVAIAGLTRAQAARVADVSVSSVSIVASATTDEIEALRRGKLSLRDVRRAHAKNRKPSIDENLMRRTDPNVVMRVFDRMTAPATPIAAE